MKFLDVISIIACLWIIGYTIHSLINIIRETIGEISGSIKRKRKKEVISSTIPVSNETESNHDEDIIAYDPYYQLIVSFLTPYWRWMSLAGGTDPLLYPQIHFGGDGTITLIKYGYDLWTVNWTAYKEGNCNEARMQALEAFSSDLFGKYADKLHLDMAYIADHLIEFEDSEAYYSNFKLIFSYSCHLEAKYRSYLMDELRHIVILENEGSKKYEW